MFRGARLLLGDAEDTVLLPDLVHAVDLGKGAKVRGPRTPGNSASAARVLPSFAYESSPGVDEMDPRFALRFSWKRLGSAHGEHAWLRILGPEIRELLSNPGGNAPTIFVPRTPYAADHGWVVNGGVQTNGRGWTKL